MIYGYARVSTVEQNAARQIKQLKEAGCEYIYEEKVSGATTERPQLQAMLDALQPGDVVIVSDLTRISRSSRHLFELVDEIKAKGASLKSIKDTWLDTTSVLMTYYIVHNLTAFVVRALTEILSKSYLKERENHDNSPSTTRLTIWSSMMRCPFCAP